MGLQSMWALKDTNKGLGVGGGEKPSAEAQVVINGEEQMTKDPAAEMPTL